MNRYYLLLISLLFLPLLSQAQFTEVSLSKNINHLNIAGNLMGGGVAFFDYDHDGFEDLYFTGGAQSDRLFRNVNGRVFEDVTEQAGLAVTANYITMAVTTGDVNHDGYRDIFVGTNTEQPNLLFMSNGDGTYTEMAAQAGLVEEAWTMGGTFGDFDLDGDLDLYVVNYLDSSIFIYNNSNDIVGFNHNCQSNFFYVNNGDNTFTESSAVLGLGDAGCALATAFTDYDQDGDLDIYLANDFGAWVQPNRLFRNEYPNVGFTEVSVATGVDAQIYGMGIATGDVNEDGNFDYYVTNIGKNVMYLNNGNNSFTDITDQAGVGSEFTGTGNATGWGAFFFDYDNDTHQDLYVGNGFIGAAEFLETRLQDPNHLFKGNGQGLFTDVTEQAGVGNDWVGRGTATGDFNNDGKPDMAVAVTYLNIGIGDFHALLYENTDSTAGNWLKVKLEGTLTNYDAYGARLHGYKNGRVFIREVGGGSSHASQNSSIVHFGLGQYNTLDSLLIYWPGQAIQRFTNVPVNQSIYVVQGQQGYEVMGCTDRFAENYNPEATFSSGCAYSFEGCTDPDAANFNPFAEVDNGTCNYVTSGPANIATGVTLYPNPVANGLNLQINGGLGGEYGITIVDGFGRAYYQAMVASQVYIETSTLPNGVYFVQITRHGAVLATRKFIKLNQP